MSASATIALVVAPPTPLRAITRIAACTSISRRTDEGMRGIVGQLSQTIVQSTSSDVPANTAPSFDLARDLVWNGSGDLPDPERAATLGPPSRPGLSRCARGTGAR